MALLQQIEQAFIKAFKERNQPVVLVLRGLKAAIKNAQIAARKQELTEDEVVKVLRSESKKRKEALELYQQGGRPELAEREQHELDIISAYLPVQMDEQQVRACVREVIAKTGAHGGQDLGKVMGAVMQKVAGKADGSLVNRIVKEELG